MIRGQQPILPKLRLNGAFGTFLPEPTSVTIPAGGPFVSRVPATPLRPILFLLAFAGLGSKKLGRPAGVVRDWGRTPLPATRLLISGVTKDSAGAILGSCAVALYRTADDKLMERTTSDVTTGAYAFQSVVLGSAYYVVAYKAGSPDVAGTTVNTLTGAE